MLLNILQCTDSPHNRELSTHNSDSEEAEKPCSECVWRESLISSSLVTAHQHLLSTYYMQASSLSACINEIFDHLQHVGNKIMF